MEFLKNHYKNVQEGSEVIGFALSSSVAVTTIDGKTFNYPYDNIAHAFAIVDITEDNSENVVGFGVSYNNEELQINLKELILNVNKVK